MLPGMLAKAAPRFDPREHAEAEVVRATRTGRPEWVEITFKMEGILIVDCYDRPRVTGQELPFGVIYGEGIGAVEDCLFI